VDFPELRDLGAEVGHCGKTGSPYRVLRMGWPSITSCVEMFIAVALLKMKKAVAKKRGRGRPRKANPNTTIVSIALSPSDVKGIASIMTEADIKSRSEATRLLIEKALADLVDKPSRKAAIRRLVERGRR
jgi:hypothetical protein